MKGLVIKNTRFRSRPSVNAIDIEDLDINEIILIKDRVEGDYHMGINEWYLLENGLYVWSGAVSLINPLKLYDNNGFAQFLISYRKLNKLNKPATGSTDIPEKLSFQKLLLPTGYEQINMHEDEDFFVADVVQEVSKLPLTKKHIFVYIPGYQLTSNLGLALWEDFVQSHLKTQEQSVAKVIFFTWPSHSLSRKKIDDRAINAGIVFAKNKLFTVFQKLSAQLQEKGKTLNLIVHSFGHQLLNGFLNAGLKFTPDSRVFHRVFLMAPDIAVGSVAEETNGVTLKNYYQSSYGLEYNVYSLHQLKHLSKSIHVFWDPYDYLLHVSTKKFALKIVNTADEAKFINQYKNLGNYGFRDFGNFFNHNIQEIVKTSSGDFSDFGFRNLADKPKWKEEMDGIIHLNKSYMTIGDPLQIIATNGKLTNHHRYLFTSHSVVNKINEILNNTDLDNIQEIS